MVSNSLESPPADWCLRTADTLPVALDDVPAARRGAWPWRPCRHAHGSGALLSHCQCTRSLLKWQLHLCSHRLCEHSDRALLGTQPQRLPLLLRSAELVAVDAGSGAASKGAPDEPAGHPVRHEPHRRHDRSKNYRGIMDARSTAGDGGAALAARPQCGLLTGEAFGAPRAAETTLI